MFDPCIYILRTDSGAKNFSRAASESASRSLGR